MPQDIMHEEWRRVDEIEGCEGYHGYEVSSFGRVRSFRDHGGNITRVAKSLTISVARNGYCYVTVYRHRKAWRALLHRLVLRAFVGPCPDGMEARHFPSNDRTNCRIDNLCWGTREQNVQDRADMGMTPKGTDRWNAVLDEPKVLEIRRRREDGEHLRDLASEFGVSKSLIGAIHTRTAWKHI